MISLSMIYMQVVDDDVSIFWYLAFCENFRLFLSSVWFRKYFVAVFLSLLERLLLFLLCFLRNGLCFWMCSLSFKYSS